MDLPRCRCHCPCGGLVFSGRFSRGLFPSPVYEEPVPGVRWIPGMPGEPWLQWLHPEKRSALLVYIQPIPQDRSYFSGSHPAPHHPPDKSEALEAPIPTNFLLHFQDVLAIQERDICRSSGELRNWIQSIMIWCSFCSHLLGPVWPFCITGELGIVVLTVINYKLLVNY